MNDFSHLEPILKKLPGRPGVYLMRSRTDDILYVGKSVNLKSRVNSYFQERSTLNAGKKQMVRQVATIDWIETASEVEALVLETNLIKTHRPKYNVLMKDDKNLAYIVVNEENVGEVHKTRAKGEKGTYFWPFPGGVNITGTVKTLGRIFRVRSCRVKFAREDGTLKVISKAGKTLPCMDHYIGLCPAPCLLTPENLAAHEENVQALKRFLRGQMSETIAVLREKMMDRARNLEFEEAGKIKEQIGALETLSERQIARDAVKGNMDNVEYLEKYGKRFIATTTIRNSEITGIVASQVDAPFEESPVEITELAIAERYVSEEPPECLLIESTLVSDSLRDFLATKGVRIEHPVSGTKSEIRAFTEKNLLNFAYRTEMERLTNRTLSRSTMENVLVAIGYEPPKKGPIVFECYDNSHTDGHFTVASRSVIVNGKSENSLYRKYKLKTLEEDKIDDFESMREIMERRTIEGLEQGNFPTLIVIDGGKGQLSSALEGVRRGLESWKLGNEQETGKIPAYAGMTKDAGMENPEKGAMRGTCERVQSDAFVSRTWKNAIRLGSEQAEPANENRADPVLPYFASIAKREEEIFVPNEGASFRFEPGSAELMLLQKIRDEAHRFAISFNRKLRTGEMKKNLLEELPGFGPTTRKKLLKLAGSVDAIRELSRENLETACNKTQIETLVGHGFWSE